MAVIRGVLIWASLSGLIYIFLFMLDRRDKKRAVWTTSRIIAAGVMGLILSLAFIFLNQLQGL